MLEIRESQIEDIFASQLDEVRNLLSIKDSISLISRQKKLPSGGKLDLLFLSATDLLLLELKVVRSETIFCSAVYNPEPISSSNAFLITPTDSALAKPELYGKVATKFLFLSYKGVVAFV